VRSARLLFFALPLVACLGCDQATKQLAAHALAGSPGLSLAADAVRFELFSNPGGFLSLGARLPEALRHGLFVFGVPLLLAGVCAGLLAGNAPRRRLLGAALLAGGGLGNWLDRLLHDGAVTDFVSVGFGSLRSGVFNVADVAVGLGILLVLWAGERPSAPAGEPPAATPGP
jgi:signal peptidase II